MFELEDTYWWFAGRRHLVRRLIGELGLPGNARILDAGCGTGAGLDNIEQLGHAFGLDASPEALRFCRKRGKSRLFATSLESPGVLDGSFDAATMLDVLEHIDDDRRALQSLFRLLRPGGHLILTVPAYPFLWSEHDEALHHKRRYRARDLATRVRDAGFRIRRMSGLVSTFLPPIVAYRLLQRLFPHRSGPKTSFIQLPAAFNAMLKGLLVAEVEVSRHIPFPLGCTLYVLAERPATVAVPVHDALRPVIGVAASPA